MDAFESAHNAKVKKAPGCRENLTMGLEDGVAGCKSLWAKRRCVVSKWQFLVGGLQHLKFRDHELSWSSCFCLRIFYCSTP